MKERIIKSVVEADARAVVASLLQEQLGATDQDMQLLIRLLSEEGTVIVIDRHLFHSSVVEGCLDSLLGLFKEENIVELARFREATGLSRNIAVPILEYFDLKGITRREGKGRALLSKAK